MKITAMPKFIGPVTADSPLVQYWKRFADSALVNKRNSTKSELLNKNPVYSLWHFYKNSREGVFAIESNLRPGKASFIYVWRTYPEMHSTEALAIRFEGGVRGEIVDVFWNYLLPKHKSVLTDAEYSDDGHRWFEAQYAYAFRHPNLYQVFTVGMTDKTDIKTVDLQTYEEFDELQFHWWGSTNAHENYRFGIRLKGPHL